MTGLDYRIVVGVLLVLVVTALGCCTVVALFRVRAVIVRGWWLVLVAGIGADLEEVASD